MGLFSSIGSKLDSALSFSFFSRSKKQNIQEAPLGPSQAAIDEYNEWRYAGPNPAIRDFGHQDRSLTEALEVLHENAPGMPGLNLFLDTCGFRSMNRSIRDMNEAARLNLMMRCETISVINPLAVRGMAIRTDLIVSEGFKLESTAKNEQNKKKVQDVLDSHWELNRWEEEMFPRIMDLGVLGEQVARVPPLDRQVGNIELNPNYNPGIFRCGLVLPHMVRRIVLEPWNYEHLSTIYLQEVTYPGMEVITNNNNMELKIINDERIDSNDFGCIRGEVFYTSVNRRPGATRGLSDLAPIVDWLDIHDQMFFSDIERAEMLKRFTWDVTLKGASPTQCEKYLRKIKTGPPRPGTVRVHNESEIWDAISPDLKVGDCNELRNSLFLHCWGGMGLPKPWYVEGGDTNRACHSEDTETLTIDGWKKLEDLSENSIVATFNPGTGDLEYQKADKLLIYDYTGKMISFYNQNFDVLVTPEHKMWARRCDYEKKSEDYKEIQAKDMLTLKSARYAMQHTGNWKSGIDEDFILPSVPCHIGRAIYPEINVPGDLWAEFLGYVISEGHIRRNEEKPKQYLVTVCQKKPRGVKLIRECINKLNNLGFRFIESQHKDDGTYVWSINDKGLSIWLRKNCGMMAKNKKIPTMCWNWTSRRQKILFDALIEGDGSINPNRSDKNRRGCVYYTTSQQLTDDVQRLSCHLGMTSKRRIAERCWAIQILDHKESKVRRDRDGKESGIKEVDYSGKVYCFEVPNHFFITRRNSKIVVSHNTFSGGMTDPCFAWARTRKRLVSQRLLLESRYAVQVASQAGRLSGVPVNELGVRVVSRDPDRRGYEGVGSSWKDVADSLNVLVQNHMLDTTSAGNIVRVVLGNYGFEIDPSLLEKELKSLQQVAEQQLQQQQQMQQQQAAQGQDGQPPPVPTANEQGNKSKKGIMGSNNPLDAIMNEAFPWLERAKKDNLDLPVRF